jgi:bifunctional non-homologous end joining protein LigD
VWVANQAAIELHPFQWVVAAPRRPTTLVFDLDPGPPAGLVECARVALHLRKLLMEIGLASFAKTSGSLGLHLHVPLGRPHDAERLKAIARGFGTVLADRFPELVVAEVKKAERPGKVYLDWLQNDATRQTVAPYSLRGSPWPTVAAPVTWAEVERAAADARPESLIFLAEHVVERLRRDGDLFADVLGLEQSLPRV